MRLLIISYQDVDVTKGLRDLLKMPNHTINEIVAPLSLGKAFSEGIVVVADEHDLALTEAPLVSVMLNDLRPDDILAFVWDDSELVHKAYLSTEDHGLSTWDISDGLAAIEAVAEEDDLEEEVVSAFLNLMDAMTDYITENVMTMIEHRLEHMAEDDDE